MYHPWWSLRGGFHASLSAAEFSSVQASHQTLILMQSGEAEEEEEAIV